MKNKKILYLLIGIVIIALITIVFIINKSNKPDNSLLDLQDKKIAIIYYSASGNTVEIAELLEQKVNADVIRIETEEEVPDKFREIMGYVIIREKGPWTIKTKIDNLDEYDVIFLGYPLWYAEVAYPMQYFIENNDLSGKTIIPFVTSNGNGLMSTPTYIQEKQPNAKVIKNGLELNAEIITSDDVWDSKFKDLDQCEQIIDTWLKENTINEN